jgi:hypothetical protein
MSRIAAIVLAASLIAAPSAAGKTTVRHVWPMTAAGELKPAWRVSHTYHGSDCWTTGISPGAYRCMTAGSLIFEPCFAAAPAGGSERVFCPLAPWRRAVADLRISGYPDVTPDTSYHGIYQGLTVADGRHCQFMQGATDVVDGKRVNYACPRNRFLIGNPSRRTRNWRIQAVKRRGNAWIKTHKLKVRIAWRYRRP